MIRKVDRIAVVVLTTIVGLSAVVPGWTMMTTGTVGGFDLPAEWLSGSAPFRDYAVPGLVLLVVVGGGDLVAAAVSVLSERLSPIAGLAAGLMLVGWIAGELVFMTQTMVLTWVVLGTGLALIALSA